MKRLYFFGDSICFGQYISPHLTWVHMLSVHLLNTLLQNPSVNGDITRAALDRMNHDVLSHYPDIVYIQFGINDSNIWDTDNGIPRVPIKSFEANLYEMVERCKAFNVSNLIFGTNHKILSKDHNERNLKYNEVIRSVAKGHMLIDHELNSLPEWLMSDGVHLSVMGHLAYFKEFTEKCHLN